MRIAKLNDLFRQTFIGGQVVTTSGIAALGEVKVARVLSAVREFRTFTEGNDPYGHHDFGSVEIDGEKVFWKIDYYDKAMEYGSEDPGNPAITTRVLTIMLASEY